MRSLRVRSYRSRRGGVGTRRVSSSDGGKGVGSRLEKMGAREQDKREIDKNIDRRAKETVRGGGFLARFSSLSTGMRMIVNPAHVFTG